MQTHIFNKFKLDKNEVLITSFEHCLKIYYILKDNDYKEINPFDENYIFNEDLFLKNIKEDIGHPTFYEYDLIYLLNGKVDIVAYKIDNVNKTFCIVSHRVG